MTVNKVSGYEGWDYTSPPDENCDCKRPQFKSDGVCLLCQRQVKGTTLSVENVSVDMKAMFKLVEKKQGE